MSSLKSMPDAAAEAARVMVASSRELPRRAASAAVARDALAPAPVTPTLADVQVPPLTVTDAATPTMAKCDALFAIFAYAAPEPAAWAGILISVRISLGSRAVVNRSTKKSSAETDRVLTRPDHAPRPCNKLGAERNHDGRQVGGGV